MTSKSIAAFVGVFLVTFGAHAETPLPAGMTFVDIPEGSFQMGCVEYTNECGGAELPIHTVTLSSYQIMTTEVTQAMWKELMTGDNPSRFSDCDLCPVENMSWGDAQLFVEQLNLRFDGWFYQLPTEAQWEYAARAGTTTEYFAGNGEEVLNEIAWYPANAEKKTHAVATKAPNAFGLYDMHGNVWEWVLDWFGDYTEEPQTDPYGPEDGTYRIIRGGGWLNDYLTLRSATRWNYGPDEGDRYSDVGFRLVRSKP